MFVANLNLRCSFFYQVTKDTEKSFSDIMKHYRSQPQAHSSIYRNVLLTREPDTTGDLIYFYNNIYVQVMKSLVFKFSNTSTSVSDLVLYLTRYKKELHRESFTRIVSNWTS